MKKLTLICLLMLATLAWADIPANYYNNAEGLSGENLKTALHNIIDNHHAYGYDWTIEQVEEDPNNSSNVILIYTGRSIPKSPHGDMTNWNREHVWPQSHGCESSPMRTDLHHLRASDSNVNSSRGNKDYDNCPGGTEVWDSGYYAGRYSSTAWEPPDAVKGDIARSLLYMDVRYEGSPELDLELANGTGTSGYTMGNKATLLQWNQQDPPSDWESIHNDRVYALQNNRNPFIDHPEYANYIWLGETPGPSTPVVVTNSVTDFSQITAVFGGQVTDNGGEEVTSRGLSWAEYNVNINPVPGGNGVTSVTLGSGVGSFSNTITPLLPNTAYAVKAWAVNQEGTGYGDVVTFTTSQLPSPQLQQPTGITQNSFTTTWSEVEGAESYRLDVHTHYSFGVNAVATELFISEYCEGSSNNKYIEIYNGTGQTLDLSPYSIKISSNANTFTNAYSFIGNSPLANGQTFVIANTQASEDILNNCDDTAGSITFNGNDAIGLFRGTELIDVVGVESGNTIWSVAGVDGATANHTLVRKATVLGPSAPWVPGDNPASSEWNVNSQDDFSDIGTHTFGSTGREGNYVTGYQDLPVDGTSRLISGLEPGVTYWLRVRAYAATSLSQNSTAASVQTQSASGAAVATLGVASVLWHRATVMGEVTNENSSAVTSRGFCWIEGSGIPTVANNSATVGDGLGQYLYNLARLSADQTYSVCAWAQNAAGVTYGNIVEFATPAQPGSGSNTQDAHNGTVDFPQTSLDIAFDNASGTSGADVSVDEVPFAPQNPGDAFGAIQNRSDFTIVISNNTGFSFDSAELHFDIEALNTLASGGIDTAYLATLNTGDWSGLYAYKRSYPGVGDLATTGLTGIEQNDGKLLYNQAGSYLYVTVTGFSELAFTSNEMHTLPVMMSSFCANWLSEDGRVGLSWSTNSETGLLGFNLLRAETAAFAEATRLNTQIISAANTSQGNDYTYNDADLLPPRTYYYWLQSVSLDGTMENFGPDSLFVPTSTEDDTQVPPVEVATSLLGNNPNPFNPTTTIYWQLKEPGQVNIDIYNTRGRLVRSLNAARAASGPGNIVWDGKDAKGRPVGSGLYLYRFVSGKTKAAAKMLMIK